VIFCGLKILEQHHTQKKNLMPLVDELLDELVVAQWFTELDLCSGHHQI
jgi:hypothetical protein